MIVEIILTILILYILAQGVIVWNVLGEDHKKASVGCFIMGVMVSTALYALYLMVK